MKVIIEDTWNEDGEAEDIIKYCTDNNYEYLLLDPEKIKELDHQVFFNCIYFCNTDIVRHHLQEMNLSNNIIPDTYESIYERFYSRKIEKINFGDIDINTLKNPIFIKPTENDKSFDGSVISKDDPYTMQLILASETKPTKETLVYKSDVVNFISEYRLLIGNGKLYGSGFICGKELGSFMEEMNIKKIIELTDENFRCIDIGFIAEPLHKWAIVEINPPFSLDDHDIPLPNYMNFCIDACNWINSKVKFIS